MGFLYAECEEMDDPYNYGKAVGEACSVSIVGECADGLTCQEY